MALLYALASPSFWCQVHTRAFTWITLLRKSGQENSGLLFLELQRVINSKVTLLEVPPF